MVHDSVYLALHKIPTPWGYSDWRKREVIKVAAPFSLIRKRNRVSFYISLFLATSLENIIVLDCFLQVAFFALESVLEKMTWRGRMASWQPALRDARQRLVLSSVSSQHSCLPLLVSRLQHSCLCNRSYDRWTLVHGTLMYRKVLPSVPKDFEQHKTVNDAAHHLLHRLFQGDSLLSKCYMVRAYV
jgi:hypothetical protein